MYRCVDGPRRGCSPTPSPGCAGGLSSHPITRSWDFYELNSKLRGRLINPPGTRWLDDRQYSSETNAFASILMIALVTVL